MHLLGLDLGEALLPTMYERHIQLERVGVQLGQFGLLRINLLMEHVIVMVVLLLLLHLQVIEVHCEVV